MAHITLYMPLIKLVVFYLSFTIHEIAHGYAAFWSGDHTPKKKGRLTLLPWKHMDMTGSVIVPGILFIMGSDTIIGWGKPVPVDFSAFSRPQHLWVASAGALANLVLAGLGLVFYALTHTMMKDGCSVATQAFCITGFMFLPINLVLCLFNIIPLCPFDGWVFFKGFSRKRKKIKDHRVHPLTVSMNIALAFVILKISTPFLIRLIKSMTIDF
ncbi:MAG: site-2 protease family protein [Proteobacteria bacterium]|nr:site-2 protease family protein [Pseudomonadota bacterium]